MISVIIPAYNLENYITRTLDSVLAQTYQDIEIIVVDDGSKDGTAAILDGYAERFSKRIRVIHKENGGVTSARLDGVRNANGEWIGFVDGDDEIESDMYERLLNNAVKYHADISHCGYQMCFEDGRINYFHNTGCLVKQDKPKGLTDLLDGSIIEPGLWNKLYRKTLFHDLLYTDIMDSTIKINEDLLMNFILFHEASLSVFEDVCKYHYIVRSGSASRQQLNAHKIYDPIRVKELIVQSAIPEVLDIAKRAYCGTCINVYNTLITAGGMVYMEDIKKVRNCLENKSSDFSLLGRRYRVMAWMIVNCPWLYQPLYRFYERYIQKKKYD